MKSDRELLAAAEGRLVRHHDRWGADWHFAPLPLPDGRQAVIRYQHREGRLVIDDEATVIVSEPRWQYGHGPWMPVVTERSPDPDA